MNLDGSEKAPYIPESLETEDKWILSLFNKLAKEVTDNLDKFELGIAVQKLYDFIWDIFCDWYIEIAKIRLQQGGEKAEQVKAVLIYIMSETLKLLHPFMPFITEEIWQTLPHDGETIMKSAWPVYSDELNFAEDEEKMESIMGAIRAIRNRRGEMNVPPSRKAKVYIATEKKDVFALSAVFMQRLASASETEIGDSFDHLEDAVCIVTHDAKIYIPMGELVDFEAERKRLTKELEAAQKKLDQINNKLNNPGFLSKAPESVVEGQKQEAAKLNEKVKMINESLAKLK